MSRPRRDGHDGMWIYFQKDEDQDGYSRRTKRALITCLSRPFPILMVDIVQQLSNIFLKNQLNRQDNTSLNESLNSLLHRMPSYARKIRSSVSPSGNHTGLSLLWTLADRLPITAKGIYGDLLLIYAPTSNWPTGCWEERMSNREEAKFVLLEHRLNHK